MSLAPLTVLTAAKEPFTKTAPSDLLAQVRQVPGFTLCSVGYGGHPSDHGVATSMENVVGISYMGSVCNGDAADSLSEGAHSAVESALIAAPRARPQLQRTPRRRGGARVPRLHRLF